ncbi:GNAT family N-acetyltransferase [Candidatus Parcubacteria bacterium]|nr:GNAT family N-acetyltransferase [Candidatus Parcubacteria bacterium]
MKIEQHETSKQKGIKFIMKHGDQNIASAYLYILYNDFHKRPFGIVEYVIVDEAYRSQGLGTKIVKAMIAEAKKQNCYKLLLWSRYSKPKVHLLYKKLGFKDWGKEFRLNFN